MVFQLIGSWIFLIFLTFNSSSISHIISQIYLSETHSLTGRRSHRIVRIPAIAHFGVVNEHHLELLRKEKQLDRIIGPNVTHAKINVILL